MTDNTSINYETLLTAIANASDQKAIPLVKDRATFAGTGYDVELGLIKTQDGFKIVHGFKKDGAAEYVAFPNTLNANSEQDIAQVEAVVEGFIHAIFGRQAGKNRFEAISLVTVGDVREHIANVLALVESKNINIDEERITKLKTAYAALRDEDPKSDIIRDSADGNLYLPDYFSDLAITRLDVERYHQELWKKEQQEKKQEQQEIQRAADTLVTSRSITKEDGEAVKTTYAQIVDQGVKPIGAALASISTAVVDMVPEKHKGIFSGSAKMLVALTELAGAIAPLADQWAKTRLENAQKGLKPYKEAYQAASAEGLSFAADSNTGKFIKEYEALQEKHRDNPVALLKACKKAGWDLDVIKQEIQAAKAAIASTKNVGDSVAVSTDGDTITPVVPSIPKVIPVEAVVADTPTIPIEHTAQTLVDQLKILIEASKKANQLEGVNPSDAMKTAIGLINGELVQSSGSLEKAAEALLRSYPNLFSAEAMATLLSEATSINNKWQAHQLESAKTLLGEAITAQKPGLLGTDQRPEITLTGLSFTTEQSSALESFGIVVTANTLTTGQEQTYFVAFNSEAAKAFLGTFQLEKAAITIQTLETAAISSPASNPLADSAFEKYKNAIEQRDLLSVAAAQIADDEAASISSSVGKVQATEVLNRLMNASEARAQATAWNNIAIQHLSTFADSPHLSTQEREYCAREIDRLKAYSGKEQVVMASVNVRTVEKVAEPIAVLQEFSGNSAVLEDTPSAITPRPEVALQDTNPLSGIVQALAAVEADKSLLHAIGTAGAEALLVRIVLAQQNGVELPGQLAALVQRVRELVEERGTKDIQSIITEVFEGVSASEILQLLEPIAHQLNSGTQLDIVSPILPEFVSPLALTPGGNINEGGEPAQEAVSLNPNVVRLSAYKAAGLVDEIIRHLPSDEALKTGRSEEEAQNLSGISSDERSALEAAKAVMLRIGKNEEKQPSKDEVTQAIQTIRHGIESFETTNAPEAYKEGLNALDNLEKYSETMHNVGAEEISQENIQPVTTDTSLSASEIHDKNNADKRLLNLLVPIAERAGLVGVAKDLAQMRDNITETGNPLRETIETRVHTSPKGVSDPERIVGLAEQLLEHPEAFYRSVSGSIPAATILGQSSDGHAILQEAVKEFHDRYPRANTSYDWQLVDAKGNLISDAKETHGTITFHNGLGVLSSRMLHGFSHDLGDMLQSAGTLIEGNVKARLDYHNGLGGFKLTIDSGNALAAAILEAKDRLVASDRQDYQNAQKQGERQGFHGQDRILDSAVTEKGIEKTVITFKDKDAAIAFMNVLGDVLAERGVTVSPELASKKGATVDATALKGTVAAIQSVVALPELQQFGDMLYPKGFGATRCNHVLSELAKTPGDRASLNIEQQAILARGVGLAVAAYWQGLITDEQIRPVVAYAKSQGIDTQQAGTSIPKPITKALETARVTNIDRLTIDDVLALNNQLILLDDMVRESGLDKRTPDKHSQGNDYGKMRDALARVLADNGLLMAQHHKENDQLILDRNGEGRLVLTVENYDFAKSRVENRDKAPTLASLKAAAQKIDVNGGSAPGEVSLKSGLLGDGQHTNLLDYVAGVSKALVESGRGSPEERRTIQRYLHVHHGDVRQGLNPPNTRQFERTMRDELAHSSQAHLTIHRMSANHSHDVVEMMTVLAKSGAIHGFDFTFHSGLVSQVSSLASGKQAYVTMEVQPSSAAATQAMAALLAQYEQAIRAAAQNDPAFQKKDGTIDENKIKKALKGPFDITGQEFLNVLGITDAVSATISNGKDGPKIEVKLSREQFADMHRSVTGKAEGSILSAAAEAATGFVRDLGGAVKHVAIPAAIGAGVPLLAAAIVPAGAPLVVAGSTIATAVGVVTVPGPVAAMLATVGTGVATVSNYLDRGGKFGAEYYDSVPTPNATHYGALAADIGAGKVEQTPRNTAASNELSKEDKTLKIEFDRDAHPKITRQEAQNIKAYLRDVHGEHSLGGMRAYITRSEDGKVQVQLTAVTESRKSEFADMAKALEPKENGTVIPLPTSSAFSKEIDSDLKNHMSAEKACFERDGFGQIKLVMTVPENVIEAANGRTYRVTDKDVIASGVGVGASGGIPFGPFGAAVGAVAGGVTAAAYAAGRNVLASLKGFDEAIISSAAREQIKVTDLAVGNAASTEVAKVVAVDAATPNQ